MKGYFSLLITFLLAAVAAYSQVQLKEVTPKKQFETIKQKQPQVLSILKVLSPNGGETWEQGGQYTIRWTSKDVKGNVKIMLKKIGGSWYTIAESAPNTGSYNYTVLQSIPLGPKFLLYVMTPDEKTKDGSDRYFSITKSEIRVLAPNGGEKLEQGGEYIIRWHSSGRIEKVNIGVSREREKTKYYYSVRENALNTGSYRWTVSPKLPSPPSPGEPPRDIQPGKYKLRISAAGVKGVSDESDRSFEIIPPEVELDCGFMEYKKVSTRRRVIFARASTTVIKLTVFVKNNGRKILNRVPFTWAILKQPMNEVILQEEAGFGNVHPNRTYTTPFEFDIRKKIRVPFFDLKNKKWKKGDYSFVFEVDPKNELREAEWARENNKCELDFEIK